MGQSEYETEINVVMKQTGFGLKTTVNLPSLTPFSNASCLCNACCSAAYLACEIDFKVLVKWFSHSSIRTRVDKRDQYIDCKTLAARTCFQDVTKST